MKNISTLFILLAAFLTSNLAPAQSKAIKVLIPNDLLVLPPRTYLGISDAGMDSAQAYQQAYMRALSMAALHHGKGKGMGDYYTQSKKNSVASKFDEMYRLQMNLFCPPSSIKEVKSIYLGNREYLVFLQIDSAETHQQASESVSTSTECHDSTLLQSQVEIYLNGFMADRQENMSKKMSIKNHLSKGNIKHHEIIEYTSKDNLYSRFKIAFNNRTTSNNRCKYFYLYDSQEPILPDNPLLSYQYTTDGLWIALIEGVYKQLSAECQRHFSKVQNVMDNYRSNDSQSNDSQLSRQIGENFYFNASIRNIYYKDNKLAVDMEVKFR